MGRWGQGAGTVEQMGLGGSVGRGGALEKLELSQSCELKHSSHSRLLYCSDEPRRDKNVSDFLKNHTHTQMPGLYLPPAQAWPICFPGGGREGALGVAPHSGHLSPGTQMAQAMVEGLEGKALPCPAAHASAGLSLESSTHTPCFTPSWPEPPSHLLRLGPSTCRVSPQSADPETEAQRVTQQTPAEHEFVLHLNSIRQRGFGAGWKHRHVPWQSNAGEAQLSSPPKHVGRLGPLRKKTAGLAAGPAETPSWVFLRCDGQWASAQSSQDTAHRATLG